MYAVEFSNRSGRDLIGMAKKRTNVIRKLPLPLALRPRLTKKNCSHY